jgi:hypothetical protein
VKPKQPSEKEIQALETQKRRQERIQRSKDKVEARNIGPKTKSFFEELQELDEI